MQNPSLEGEPVNEIKARLASLQKDAKFDEEGINAWLKVLQEMQKTLEGK